ncbi:uncharacterized protein [Apostichopus japonicus]|uniref:uncharacterized protein n=1 Tax=Stichopus japonicus TaxID=307972 RepID=UPI003AB49EEF
MNTAAFIVLILSLFGKACGETIYHLRNDGIFNGNNMVLRRDFSMTRVTMCYNGLDIFVAEGNIATGISKILKIPGTLTDPEENPVIYQEIPWSYNVALDCCCKYVAYGYPTSDGYKIHLRSLEKDGVSIDFNIDDPVTIATIMVLCDKQQIRLIDKTKIYTLDITNANAPPQVIYLDGLEAYPRCADTWSDGTTEYLITSFEDRDAIQVTELTNNYVSQRRTFVVDQALLKTACITVDGDFLYSFSRMTDEHLGKLIKTPVVDIINTVNDSRIVNVTNDVAASFPLVVVGDFVNGLSVCVDCMNQDCIADSSSICLACTDSGFEHCGFCSSNRALCLCKTPQEVGCVYYDSSLEATCIRPMEKLDAYCVVLNPEAQRRDDGPIDVAVVVAPLDQANYWSSTIRRAAKTGRWPVKTLPVSQPLTKNDYMENGFSAPVPPNARGKRFGIFSTDISRTDGFVENIYCISTEKSAFRNQEFTYVSYEGGTITMEVTMDNSEFQDQVTWRVTNMETSRVKSLGNHGQLRLTISPVFKRTHEGLYEIYRVTRYLRTWHPLIYLYVRACPQNRYGFQCALICPACGNGVCDVDTGRCRCYPGFTGTGCVTPCATPDLIGQHCDIRCSEIFGGVGADCINVEICGAEDLACGCRSGLQSPECLYLCTPGTWGPNCRNSCSCPSETCDPRVGCI